MIAVSRIFRVDGSHEPWDAFAWTGYSECRRLMWVLFSWVSPLCRFGYSFLIFRAMQLRFWHCRREFLLTVHVIPWRILRGPWVVIQIYSTNTILMRIEWQVPSSIKLGTFALLGDLGYRKHRDRFRLLRRFSLFKSRSSMLMRTCVQFPGHQLASISRELEFSSWSSLKMESPTWTFQGLIIGAPEIKDCWRCGGYAGDQLFSIQATD